MHNIQRNENNDMHRFASTTGRILLTATLLPVTEIGGVFPEFPFGEHELKRRTGYYEAGGKYLGGIPKYDTEFELFECTEFNYDNSHDAPLGNEATVCLGWTESEVSSAESQVGMCSCDALATAGYCGEWSCTQLEVENKANSRIPDSDAASEGEAQGKRECSCEVEHDSGTFCALWTCAQARSSSGSDSGDGDSSSQEPHQFEQYRCVRESADAEYCEGWTGVAETSGEVTLSACECVDEWNSVAVCSYWECESRVMKRCSQAGPGWCNIGISVGVGGFFGSWGALLAAWGLLRLVHRAKQSYFDSAGYDIFFGFAWMAGWAVGVTIWGGQDGAMYAGIWWGAIVAIGLLCGWHVKTRS